MHAFDEVGLSGRIWHKVVVGHIRHQASGRQAPAMPQHRLRHGCYPVLPVLIAKNDGGLRAVATSDVVEGVRKLQAKRTDRALYLPKVIDSAT